MRKGIVLSAGTAALLTAVVAVADTQNKPAAPQNLQVAAPPGQAMISDELTTLRQQHERDKKKILELTKAVEDGKKSLADCQKARETAQKKADVRFFCEGWQTSKNSLGASESCSPYRCNDVTGLCNKRCASAGDCASGFGCDWTNGSCTR